MSRKKIIFFQDANVSGNSETATIHNSPLRIQPFDVLDIRIISSEKALENLTESRAVIPAGSSVGGYFSAYYVNERGIINLPLIGEVSLLNATIEEAKIKLQEDLKRYLKNPYVDIKFLTFKVTMLGEVVRPGVVTIPNEKANLIDAIALAGDLTDFGDRTQIKILRGDISTPLVFEVDLTSVESFTAKGFLLMPNDIVYVQPLKRKFTIGNLTTAISFMALLNTASIIITLLRQNR